MRSPPRVGVTVTMTATLLLLALSQSIGVDASPMGTVLTPWRVFTKNNVKCPGTATEPCLVDETDNVKLDRDATVRSLIVKGTLVVQPPKQKGLTLTTAFVLATGPIARLNLTADAGGRSIKVNLKRDVDAYPDVPAEVDGLLGGGRFFAGHHGARVAVEGAPLARTWTLLGKDVSAGDSTFYVVHDVSDWSKGDIVALSPSDEQFSLLGGDEFKSRFGGQTFKLSQAPRRATGAGYAGLWRVDVKDGVTPSPSPAYNKVPAYLGRPALQVQAELIHLSRSITITGDDFSASYKAIPPPPWKNPASGTNGDWPTPWSPFTQTGHAGEGLHTIQIGSNQGLSYDGGWMKMLYVRVDTAGQRGWIGRYPLHFHYMGECVECNFIGNAVVNSQQRGITIHGTSNSTVRDNVLYAVLGAGVYVEEGICLWNNIVRNVYVCDSPVQSYSWHDPGQDWVPGASGCIWDSQFNFGDPRRVFGGCRIAGTDNWQADCYQHSGIWALSVTNNFIENRVSNAYNGIYTQSTTFGAGRYGTPSLGKVCPVHSPFGIMRGNVCHSNQRFGWYPDSNYPRRLDRSVATGGRVADLITHSECMVDLTDMSPSAWCSCRATTPNGVDNAQAATYIDDGVEWGNGFVGQYDLADVSYRGFHSLLNNLGMYWKGTKNFKTVGVAHISNSVFEFPTTIELRPQWLGTQPNFLATLPGAEAAILLENVQFRGVAQSATWIDQPGNLGVGGALGINQMSKQPLAICRAMMDACMNNPDPKPPCCITEEGGLANPTVVLANVSFDGILENPLETNQATQPTWIRWGALSGNNRSGIVTAMDDSLCGGRVECITAGWRSLVPGVSPNKHLLTLPNGVCKRIDSASPWYRRWNAPVACTIPLRRLDLWGPYLGSDLVLIPPGGNDDRGYRMQFVAYSNGWNNQKKDFACVGTNCDKNEPRRFAEGYTAAVPPFESVPGVWTLRRFDGNDLDPSKIKMFEFSDQLFKKRFGLDESFKISIEKIPGPPCVLKNTDSRLWITPFGPIKKGGGSCLQWTGAMGTIRG